MADHRRYIVKLLKATVPMGDLKLLQTLHQEKIFYEETTFHDPYTGPCTNQKYVPAFMLLYNLARLNLALKGTSVFQDIIDWIIDTFPDVVAHPAARWTDYTVGKSRTDLERYWSRR